MWKMYKIEHIQFADLQNSIFSSFSYLLLVFTTATTTKIFSAVATTISYLFYEFITFLLDLIAPAHLEQLARIIKR